MVKMGGSFIHGKLILSLVRLRNYNMVALRDGNNVERCVTNVENGGYMAFTKRI
jgi:hypothetical protein